MSLGSMLTGLLRRTRNGSADDFASFVARRGAYLAQKTVLDYCAVKLGVNWNNALHDPVFTVPLNACRWRTYLAAQGDVAALAEGWLRPHAPGREASLATALAAIAEYAIRTAGPPAEFEDEVEAAIAALPPRLARLQLAAPHEATDLPLDSAPVLLATLPIHPDLRKGETVSILGALRMHLVGAQQDMERGFDPAMIASQLAPAVP